MSVIKINPPQPLENNAVIPLFKVDTQEKYETAEDPGVLMNILILAFGPIILGLMIAVIVNWCNHV
jgi:hypothetical protein